MKALSLCHTVTIDKEGNYSAASPDELAFVQFTDDAGHHYVDKDDQNNIVIRKDHKEQKVIPVIKEAKYGDLNVLNDVRKMYFKDGIRAFSADDKIFLKNGA